MATKKPKTTNLFNSLTAAVGFPPVTQLASGEIENCVSCGLLDTEVDALREEIQCINRLLADADDRVEDLELELDDLRFNRCDECG